MTAVHVFIISWTNQHNRAGQIANALSGVADRLTIVYSDRDNSPELFPGYEALRRDDRLFWADKFQACLDHCTAGAVMMIIHADCECDDWSGVVSRCRTDFDRDQAIGVWIPRLTGTPWRLERTRIKRLADSECSLVAHTDGLVFALSPLLLPRMRQANYSQNVYGLGIDWMFLCAAYSRGMVAIANESIVVRHRLSRGYSSGQARAQKRQFLKQLTPSEAITYQRLRTHLRRRKIYAKILFQIENLRARVQSRHT